MFKTEKEIATLEITAGGVAWRTYLKVALFCLHNTHTIGLRILLLLNFKVILFATKGEFDSGIAEEY
jgi:hypothetical protein